MGPGTDELILRQLEITNGILRQHGESLATVQESQKNIKERLFGGDGQPGAIGYLHAEHEKLAAELVVVKKTADSAVTDRRIDKAYMMGASAVLTLGAKWVLGKVGINI